MGKITKEMYEAAYSLAKDVYVHQNFKTKAEAKSLLQDKYKMNFNSANIYLRCFEQMNKGQQYNMTISKEALEYYLKNIYQDFHLRGLKKALHSLERHLQFYKNQGKGELTGQKSIHDKYLKYMEHKSNNFSDHPDEDEITESTVEGAKKKVIVNKYERSAKEKKRCLEKYGATCHVCTVDFKEEYGEIGEGFIHVHHLKPLHTIKEEYKVDGEKDLRPVCPNCHAMLHKGNPIYSISELKKIIKETGGKLSERF